jgi:hypothetical protein
MSAKSRSARSKPAPKTEEECDFDRQLALCWSVKRVLAQLPESVEGKKTVLRIVDRLLGYEIGDAWNGATQ